MKRKILRKIIVIMIFLTNTQIYADNNISNLAYDLAKISQKQIVDNKQIKTVNPLIFFNGDEQRFSNDIKNYKGITYLPFREVANPINVKADWIEVSKSNNINGIAKFSNDTVSIEILNQTAISIVTKDGKSEKVVIKNNGNIIPALNINGVTYVPIRYISEVFGMKIEYTQSNKITNTSTIEIYNTSEKPTINYKETKVSDSKFDKKFDEEFNENLFLRDKLKGDIFSEGLASAYDEYTKKYGFIDTKENLVIPYQFDEVDRFREGLCAVYDNNTEKWGFIDKTGKLVIPYQFIGTGEYGNDLGTPIFSEGLAAVYNEDTGEYGYIDKTGKLVIPYQFDMVGHFKEGRAYVKNLGSFEEGYFQYGYIDKTGKLVIPYQFDEASNFITGLARVSLGNKATGVWYVGYIDETGKEVIPFKLFY